MVLELPEDDPMVVAIVEDALAPHRERLTPEALADARELVLLYVTTHPEMVAMIDSLRPRTAVAASGDVERLDPGELDTVSRPGLRSGGSR
jgi:hypothetical protein